MNSDIPDIPDCCVLFDNCPNQGRTQAEHCAAGMHCTSTTASCSAEQSGNDHPSTCCDCKSPLIKEGRQ